MHGSFTSSSRHRRRSGGLLRRCSGRTGEHRHRRGSDGLVAQTAAAAPAADNAASSKRDKGGGSGKFEPGAPGVGDPYFPLEGNGGYDTQHYDLSFSYDPATDRLEGLAVITAEATQDLSRFDLDLQQLEVSSVTVDRHAASFIRDGQELQITPHNGLHEGRTFVTTVRYGGVPQTIVGSPIVFGSPYGFLHTDDGAFMGDEPNVASTWFPVSDHPQDKSSYTFRVTVPKGLGVVANGQLKYQMDTGDSSLFVWNEPDPMASYLVTADIGRWLVKQGRTPGGIPEYVAVDPVLPDVTATRNGMTKTAVGAGLLLRLLGRGRRPVDADVRPVSVRERRRDRRQRDLQRHAARLLAGDADQAGVLGRPQPEHDRPRAGAHVVRRQRLRAHVGQHLAQRGLRDVRRVPVGRALRHAHAHTSSSSPTTRGRRRRRSGSR